MGSTLDEARASKYLLNLGSAAAAEGRPLKAPEVFKAWDRVPTQPLLQSKPCKKQAGAHTSDPFEI